MSYEGSFTAADGPAIGITSTDIGVSETSSTPIGESLQLGGTGTQYSDFTWNPPAAETKGIINNGQTFSGGSLSTITVTPTLLSGFSYVEGLGPSSEQSFDISGSDLTADISITPPANYEISTGTGGSFVPTDPIILVHSGGVVSSTTIYVRLKAGLVLGEYNGENITATSTGADDKTVTCNGAVVKTEPTNHATSLNGVLGDPSYYYINLSWTDATGGTDPDGYLIKVSPFHYDSIATPVDGVSEPNSYYVQDVLQGVQADTFGYNSGTTYYFKIFSYTNSGIYIDYKLDGGVPQLSIATDDAPTLPLNENFEYTVGTTLTDNGWIAHSGVGTNPIQVADTTLTYTDYVNSGTGNAVTMTVSGEDVNRAFSNVSTESIYASFMVNLTSAQTGTYFFHFAPENSSLLFYGKVFAKKDTSDNVAFGVAKRNTGDVIYTPFNYALNTTYLIVVKYTFNPTTIDDDTVKLWINPSLVGPEPVADIIQTDSGDDAWSLGMFALRQGSSSSSAELILGGIRIADTWVTDPGSTTFPLSVLVDDGWNMVSIPGLHPVNQDVTTWWPTLTGNVFKFSGGYEIVTTAIPGEGYWMKNSGAETYNHPAINIIPHDPIPGATGWNMFGGYENSAPTGGLTTTPPGLISGSVFGYSAGYFVAANLEPGYGYWIKLTGTGVINIPGSLSKGSSEVVEYFKDDWGKIIIIDNAGRSYTLYAVNGEVNLDNYELPPLPPNGMFDIRYGSGRIAEDINSSIQSIEMTGLEYPVRVKVENMSITLQDESGKEINAELAPGEEISIENNSINKLMVISGGIVAPIEYALEQNYPNPFNPSTVIKFSVPEATNVTLTIYNTLGQKVTELVNTKLEAGNYSYQWNAGNVATGMYIYELRTNKFVSVKKMMLMK